MAFHKPQALVITVFDSIVVFDLLLSLLMFVAEDCDTTFADR
jgi:hypothetical protein